MSDSKVTDLAPAGTLDGTEILYAVQTGTDVQVVLSDIAALIPAGADGADGIDGVDGDSAYEIAVANGFVGDETAWLASLQGADGVDGIDGTNGTNGTNGTDGADGQGVPVGGATGEYLKKSSGTDFDTEWADLIDDIKPYITQTLLGLDWKGTVRASSTANVAIATALENGASFGGVTLATGNRVLLMHQTNPAENGIYDVPASGAASRSTDMNTWAESTNAAVQVTSGTNAGHMYFTTNSTSGTLGTDPLNFTRYYGSQHTVHTLSGTTIVPTYSGYIESPNGTMVLLGTTEYIPNSGSSTAIVGTPALYVGSTVGVTGSNGFSLFGGGFTFWNQLTVNDSGSSIYTGPMYTLVDQKHVKNTSASTSKTMLLNADILINPQYSNTSSGTFNIGGSLNYGQLNIGVTLNANVTCTQRNAFSAQNATGTGSMTGQAGLVAENLTFATNNTLCLLGQTVSPSGNFNIYQGTNTYVNRWNAGHRFKYRTSSSSTITVTTADHIVECSSTASPATCTLPSAATCEGLELIIKKTGASGTLNIASVSGQTFDGAASPVALATQWHLLRIYSDGANWKILHTGAP